MPRLVFENLTRLKDHLGIKPINTGQQFNRLGIVFDDVEALHAITSIQGDCVNLMSGIEFSLAEYRGQTQEYESCLSSLDRIQHDYELFAALCRSTYFKQALETHPVITQMRSRVFNLGGSVEPLPICIDLDGIAQHYGLPTQYLDITSNFSVASFFATQRWDNKTKKFEPMRMNPTPGVIYQLQPALLIAHQGDGGIPYTPVGWQPFSRPEQQRANAVRLQVGEDFIRSLPVTSYYFQHSRNQSKRSTRNLKAEISCFQQMIWLTLPKAWKSKPAFLNAPSTRPSGSTKSVESRRTLWRSAKA